MDKRLMIVNLAVIIILIAILATSMVSGNQSIVALSRDTSSVTNAGTVDVMLERSGTTGLAVLAVDESIAVRREEDVKAEQA